MNPIILQTYIEALGDDGIGSLPILHDSIQMPKHIIDFLILLIEDGNYFPDNFFSEAEMSLLEFNKLVQINL